MKKYPKISFSFSQVQDTKNALSFIKNNLRYGNKQYVQWFIPPELDYVLEKRISMQGRVKIITSYTKEYYKKNKKPLVKEFIRVKNDWIKVEKRYFTLVDKIFKGSAWPKGKYFGFATVFLMYPRIIEKKEFYFPLRHKNPLFGRKVIGHEMLHFMFFDYVAKKYKKLSKEKQNQLWEISEVFNDVIEGWGPYKKLIPVKPQPYAGQKIYKKIKKQWETKQDIDWLLDKWFK